MATGTKTECPDDWERRCKLIVGQDDSQVDNDRDGLTNIREFQLGTSACQADTDRGGERDGSEVNGDRNPLWADDDKAFKVTGITVRPLNQRVAIGWSQRKDTHNNVQLCVSDVVGDLGACQHMGNKGNFILEGLANGQMYYLTLYGEAEDDARGVYSDQIAVTPAEDPVPPQGAFYIGGPNVVHGGDVATSRDVVLFIDAVDIEGESEGATAGFGSLGAQPGSAGSPHASMFTASGNIEMKFANTHVDLPSSAWESLKESKSWTLDCAENGRCVVVGQFRDGAGNESRVVTQQILLKSEGVGWVGRYWWLILLAIVVLLLFFSSGRRRRP